MSDDEGYTIAAYDMAVFEHQKAQDVRRHERAMQRIRSTAVVLSVAVVCVLLGFGIYIWWQAMAGPSAAEQQEHEEKVACTESSGTWVRLGDERDGDAYGTCLRGEAQ